MFKIFLMLCLLLGTISVRAAPSLPVPPELPQNLRELKARAEAGDANAQLNMGGIYFKGQQVNRDYTEGEKWFRRAAQQGQAQAQYNLGMMHASGLGVTQDQAEAVRWYRLAAEQGLAIAQLNLGVAYAYGSGLEQNTPEALKWLTLAAKQGEAANQGHATAGKLLTELNQAAPVKQPAPQETSPASPALTKHAGTTSSVYYIQLGAFKLKPHSESRAEKYRTELHNKLGDLDRGYRIYIDDGWVRIQIGPYSDADEARQRAESLKEKLGRAPQLKQY
jgi:cell division septation protein DedD